MRVKLRPMARITIRIDFDDGSAMGPGKVRLLELVATTGSIRKAAVGMKMSYRKAWLLLQAMERTFGAAPVETATGGRQGGGAKLSSLGRFVVERYRKLERDARQAAAPSMAALTRKASKAGRKNVTASKPTK